MLIAIDHGNKQIKTVHTQPFTSGLIQGDTPGFGTDCLAYQGKYYTLTDQRIPYSDMGNRLFQDPEVVLWDSNCYQYCVSCGSTDSVLSMQRSLSYGT